MTITQHRNRLITTVSAVASSGLGAFTISTASSGCRTFVAGDDGLLFDVTIGEGATSEERYQCLYTHSDTSLSRGTFESSSSGSAIAFTAACIVTETLTARKGVSMEYEMQACISGLLVTRNVGDATKIDISAGQCYDPSSGKIITYAGATAVSSGTLGVSQHNQVYIYDNAGTATIEIVNNAAPPTTTYAGTARMGGTNSNRRWIGGFFTTTGGTVIHAQDVKETGRGQFEVIYLTNPQTAPFRVLSAGSSTTYAAVSLVGIVPRYVATEFLSVALGTFVTTALDNLIFYYSIDGTNLCSISLSYVYLVNAFAGMTVWSPLEPSTPQIQYKLAAGGSGAGPRGYIDVIGYRGAR